MVFEVTIGIRSTNFGIRSTNWYSKYQLVFEVLILVLVGGLLLDWYSK
jgi:hypothetical protein